MATFAGDRDAGGEKHSPTVRSAHADPGSPPGDRPDTDQEGLRGPQQLGQANPLVEGLMPGFDGADPAVQGLVDAQRGQQTDADELLLRADLGILVVDEKLRIRRVAGTLHGLFPIIATDIGRPLNDLASRGAPASLFADLRRVIETGEPMELRAHTRDDRHLLLGLRAVRSEQGITGGVISLRNIDELGRTLAGNQRVEQLLQQTLDSLPESVAVLGPDGSILRVNQSWQTLVAHNKANLSGVLPGSNLLAACEAQPSRDAGVIAQGLRALLAGKQALLTHEYSCPLPLGIHSYRVTALRLFHQDQLSAVVLHEDITKQVLAKTELAKTEQLLAQAGEAIIATDVEEQIQSWNEAATRLLGYVSGEVLGQRADMLLPHGDLSGRLISLRHLAQSRRSEQYDRLLRKKDGYPIAVSITIAPLFCSDGALVGVSLIVRPREKASRERAVRTFLAKMTHDLHTPLNTIVGLSDVLLDSTLSTEQRRSMATIHHSAQVLLGMLGDVLSYARLETTGLILQPRPFSLRTLLAELGNLVFYRAHLKGVDVLMRVQPEVPEEVIGDETRIHQLVMNLMSNALKFTSRGYLLASLEALDLTTTDVQLQLLVEDTGTGIAPEHQDRLFLPFSQIGEARGGMGLGLSICRQIVDAMQGTIEVESQVGHGARFRVIFRLPVQSMASMPRPRLPSDLPLLVIDPRVLRRNFIVSTLQAAGAMVTVMSTVDEARRKVDLSSFSAILLPAQEPLPDYGGRQLMLAASAEDLPSGVYHIQLPLMCFSLVDRINQALRADLVVPGGPSGPVPLSLLLVDDNPVGLKMLSLLAESLGHVVETATDGGHALDILSRKAFDGVLLDLQMPVVDGFAVARQLRQRDRESGQRTAIIAVTASASPVERAECLAVGMDAFLTKPARKGDLELTLLSVLGADRLRGGWAMPALLSLREAGMSVEQIQALFEELAGKADEVRDALPTLIETRNQEALAHKLRSLRNTLRELGGDTLCTLCDDIIETPWADVDRPGNALLLLLGNLLQGRVTQGGNETG